MIQEFKDFINRGNLVDLAVAFVLGLAFASVVTAFTDRVVTPLIGLIFNVNGLEEFGTLAGGAGSVGAFLVAVINFVIVAFIMYLVVKAYNRMKPPVAGDDTPTDIELLIEIRDELKARH